MSEIIARGAEAMRTKRRELIHQPLDRIWPDLMRVAIEALRLSDQDVWAGHAHSSDDVDAFNSVIDGALKDSVAVG